MADDAELSRRYKAAVGEVAAGHLDDITWERIASDELPPPERAAAMEHVLRCKACSDIYRGLIELRVEALKFDRSVPAPPRPRLILVRAAVGVGFAAAASLLAFVVLRAPPHTDEVELRGSRTARPVAIAPVGKQAAAPALFTFEPMTGAKVHRVQMLGADGAELWSSDNLSGAQAEWPKAVPANPGKYYWQVLGFPAGPASEGIASPMVDFEITASRP
jgi:hypothetical protein